MANLYDEASKNGLSIDTRENHGKWIIMTNKLEEKIIKVHVDTISEFFEENKEEMFNDDYAFSEYMRQIFKEKGVHQQDVFLYADIPERYYFKIWSE